MNIKIELSPFHCLRILMVKKFIEQAMEDPYQGFSDKDKKLTKQALAEFENQFLAKASHVHIDDAIAENEVKGII